MPLLNSSLDNSMEFLTSRSGIGHQGFDSVMLLQPVGHKSIFHRVESSNQPNLPQAAASDCNSRSIPNMEDGQVYVSCNLCVDLVGCIGAEQDRLRAAGTQPYCRLGEEDSYFIPLPLRLELVNFLLVHVVENEGRVRAVAVRVVYGLIDVPVVVNSGIPGSATDQTERLRSGQPARSDSTVD